MLYFSMMKRWINIGLLYVAPVCVGVSIAVLVLAAAWPLIGSAWHIETDIAVPLVAPGVRVAAAWLAAAVIAAALWVGPRWAVLLAAPLVALALQPPEKFVLSSDLLASSLALEAEAFDSGADFVASLTEDPDARLALQTRIQTTQVQTWPFDRTGLDAVLAARTPTDAAWAAPDALFDADAAAALLRLQQTRASNQRRLNKALNDDYCFVEERFSCVRGDVMMDARTGHLICPGLSACERARATATDELPGQIAALDAQIAQAAERVAADRANRLDLVRALGTAAALDAAEQQARRARATLLVAAAGVTAWVLTALFHPAGMAAFWTALAVGAVGAIWVVPVLPDARPFVIASAASAASLFLGLRAVRLYALHNHHLWTAVRASEWPNLLARTGLQWLFPLAILMAGLAASNWMDRLALDPAYRGPANTVECDPDGRLLAAVRLGPDICAARHLETDTTLAVEFHFLAVENRMQIAISAGAADARGGADWADREARRLLEAAVPDFLSQREATGREGARGVSPTFDKDDCKLYQVICHLMNWGKGHAQDGYRSGRASAEATLVTHLSKLDAQVEAGTMRTEDALTLAANVALAELKSEIERALWTGFRVWDVIRHVATFSLVVAVLKTFGFVYLRNVHRIAGFNSRLPSSPERQSLNGPRVVLPDATGLLTLDATGDMCVASSVRVPGRRNRSLRLAPTVGMFITRLVPSLLVPRYANAAFRLYAVPSGSPFKLMTDRGRALCAVRLAAGERAAVRSSALVAHGGVTFRSAWAFGAINLLTGRLRGLEAVGPGLVVLRTEGTAELADPAADRHAFTDTGGLVLWSADTAFALKGESGIIATFLGATDVRPMPGGLAVGDLGRGGGAAMGFVRSFLLLLPL